RWGEEASPLSRSTGRRKRDGAPTVHTRHSGPTSRVGRGRCKRRGQSNCLLGQAQERADVLQILEPRVELHVGYLQILRGGCTGATPVWTHLLSHLPECIACCRMRVAQLLLLLRG